MNRYANSQTGGGELASVLEKRQSVKSLKTIAKLGSRIGHQFQRGLDTRNCN